MVIKIRKFLLLVLQLYRHPPAGVKVQIILIHNLICLYFSCMTGLKKTICLIAWQLLCVTAYCQTQPGSSFSLTVLNEKQQPAQGATVKLLQHNKPVKAMVTTTDGTARFENLSAGAYSFMVSYTGYKPQASRAYTIPAEAKDTLRLQPASTALQEVSVTAKTPAVQHKQGKTIVNVDASVTNTGTTVLDVLEKSPGVTVDRNGGIALQGKHGVLVMIDDKPTYLSGADLNNLLSSMSSSQVAQIELMPNPPAKYDAAGNAGIINIKTKKNKQQGFNGSFTASAGHGVYPKTNNSLVLNYRTGKVNTFLNYSVNFVEYLTDLYASRKYYSGNTVTSTLDQPGYFSGTFFNNTVKTGLDYYV
ncbi:MAG: TonB-dependent receptor, partial [Sphingobacteriales bacterium]